MRILHLLHRSVPGTHGYGVRSREIVTKQLAKGLEPIVVTSPSQPPLGELDAHQSEIIDGVRYFRTCGPLLAPYAEVHDQSPLRSSLRVVQNLSLVRKALWVAQTYKPVVIHAHSPFTCGISANITGRWHKIPTVYEMRGIWEDSHTSRYGLSEQSLRYRGVRFLENMALRHADYCVVISEGLRSEILNRGIPYEKIAIVPNGVDVQMFVPGPPSQDLEKSMGLEGKLVMGYVGSFFHYEGLDLLVEAMKLLAPEFPELRLLLVGDGEVMPNLKKMAESFELAGRIIFTGRVPYERTMDFYRLFDFLVLPRRKGRETSLVTPLKPLEIMAMSKALLASDVGGHLEIVQDEANGLLFESGNIQSLLAQCRILIQQSEFRIDLGQRGRKWVEANRDWNVLIDRYLDLYEKLSSGQSS
jgi:PEP-CTERM/exosortase A-associated glycosyltransferase